MNEYIIETKNLSKRFDDFIAVDKINLQVPKGVIYGFLGPNGAGKSTTIRMLLGLIKSTKGKAILFGKPVDQNRLEILRRVGSMVEYPSYYGHLTAYENLDIARKILEVEEKEIDKVLEIVKLTEVKNKVVKKFSLGMKQRLGIALALLGDPELLILDEPTNGLDPAGIQEIRKLIKCLPEMMGVTILVSSHILSEIELMANQVGIINKGKLIFQGTIEKLQKKSKTELKVGVNPLEDALKLLNSKGYTVSESEGFISITDKEVDPAQINQELVLSGCKVHHLSLNRKKLEDIFLDMTSENE